MNLLSLDILKILLNLSPSWLGFQLWPNSNGDWEWRHQGRRGYDQAVQPSAENCGNGHALPQHGESRTTGPAASRARWLFSSTPKPPHIFFCGTVTWYWGLASQCCHTHTHTRKPGGEYIITRLLFVFLSYISSCVVSPLFELLYNFSLLFFKTPNLG